MAQLVVVDEILVTQRDAADALHEHRLDGVLYQLRRAAVGEAPRQPSHQADRPIRGAEQQRTSVRGHLATIERRHQPGALRQLHIQTNHSYTLSASGNSSASR
jgi:hypothetical protein